MKNKNRLPIVSGSGRRSSAIASGSESRTSKLFRVNVDTTCCIKAYQWLILYPLAVFQQLVKKNINQVPTSEPTFRESSFTVNLSFELKQSRTVI